MKINLKLTILFTSIIALIGGFLIFNSPRNYVSLDINPSIMISTNLFDKVVKVEALNDDAKKIIEEENFYGKDVSNAINNIVKKATDLGYVDKNDDNVILVSTYCDNEQKREKLQQSIHKNLDEKLNNNGIRSLIIDTELTEEDAKKANEYGVSEAKILFVKQAINQNPDLQFEDLIYLPAKEIAKYIDGYEELDSGNQGNNNAGTNNQNNCQGNCNNQNGGKQYGKNNNQ